ncbi:unnamed protein product, partial [Mesorhabditis belari]|uniref:Uncharacterized protein n=1 Tax=Mesorhabditis belari TaxID=2138241 RepID=A0AAF3EIN7_9BILA
MTSLAPLCTFGFESITLVMILNGRPLNSCPDLLKLLILTLATWMMLCFSVYSGRALRQTISFEHTKRELEQTTC